MMVPGAFHAMRAVTTLGRAGPHALLQLLPGLVALVAVGWQLVKRIRRDRADPGRFDRRRLWMEDQVRQHYERVAEWERRHAAGMPAGPKPRMPRDVERALMGLSGRMFGD